MSSGILQRGAIARAIAGVLARLASTVDGLGAALIGYKYGTVASKFGEMVSVTDYGAKGDGVTIFAAEFAAMESDPVVKSFYVPEGVFLSGLSRLTKYYYGPGSVLTSDGGGVSGVPSAIALSKISGLEGVNTCSAIGRRTDVFITDSIGYGAGIDQDESWPALVQKWLNQKMAFGQSSCQTSGNLDRLTATGAVTGGTAGPLKSSRILAVGASLSFVADHVDVFACWAERAPGAGSLLFKQDGTDRRTVSYDGVAAHDVFSGVGPVLKGKKGVQYSITAVGAPVEVTGIFGSHLLGEAEQNPVFLQFQGKSGYASADFTSDAVIASIKAQILYAEGFPRIVIALGTNDIYNAATAVTAAQYGANLETIITKLNPATCSVRLVVPLRAGNTVYVPVLEPFDNYRDQVYRVARKYGMSVTDASEIDILGVGAYQGDQLHPNKYGAAAYASLIWRDMYADINAADREADVTAAGGATLVGGDYALPDVRMSTGGKTVLRGALGVASIAKGTTIGNMPVEFAPTSDTLRDVSAIAAAGGTARATLKIHMDGRIELYDYSAPLVYVWLDTEWYSG